MDAHRNFAYSTVAVAPSPALSGLSLTVASGDGAKYPTPPFNATAWPTGALPLVANAEIVRVTNISGDVLTIVRAQEGSSARSITVGDQIAATVTAKTLQDIEAAVAAGDAITSVFGRTGAVTAQTGDYTASQVGADAAGAAAAATATAAQKSANLSDLASASTARSNLGLGSAATQPSSAFDASGAASAEQTRATAAEALLAPKASPALTGTPTAPTAAAEDSSTQIATTAYVQGELGDLPYDAAGAAATEQTRAQAAEALALQKASNLSDVASPSAARTNLGLGSAATQPSSAFDAAGAASSEQTRATAAEALAAQKSANLSDLANAGTARTNLGLGSAATQASSAFDAAGAASTEQTRALAAEALLAQGFAPTAVKTSGYTAAPGDYVPVDVSGGPVTITLPTAPADKSRIGIKIVAQTATPSNAVTVAAGGSDVFNKAGGSTSVVLPLAVFSGVLLQYKSSTGIWYVQSTDVPLGTAAGAAKLGTDGTIGGPGGSALSAVASFNTRTGAVTLSKADVTGTGLAASDVGADAAGAASTEQTRAQAAEALLAPKASPALTGSPTTPTQTALDNSTKIASTAYADAAVAVEKARAVAAEAKVITRVSASTSAIHPTAAYPTGTNAGHESRQRFRSAVGGRGIELTYYLNYGIGEASNPAGADRVFNASIEYPSGTFYECFSADGKQKPSISPNGIGKLYCPGVEIPANTDFWVRSHTFGATSDAVVAAATANGTSEYGTQFVADQDHTLTASGQPAFNSSPMFGPQLVSILPYTKAVSVVGVFDSIGMGKGDPDINGATNSGTAGGWFGRALSTDGSGRMSPALPFVMLGISSETVANFASVGKRLHRFAIMDQVAPNYAFVGLATNDIGGLAGAESNLVLVWQACANRGASVFAATLPPISTSTDSFATTANQTVGINEANRVSLNTWIRAGAPIDPSAKTPVAVGTGGALVAGNVGHPLCSISHPNGGAGYVEVADAVESSRNSGFWKVDGTTFKYTIDGTHPSTFGHTAITANVSKALLV